MTIVEYKVYKHINKINNLIYIGITMQPINSRWGMSGQKYKKNKRFWKDIQEFGWDNFEHIVLFDRLTKIEAQKIEIELIDYHNSNNQDFGYNNQRGGNLGNLGIKFPEEVRQKIKNNHADNSGVNNYWYGKKGALSPNFGKNFTQEHKDKISKALSGKNNPMYGKHHSKETIDKIRKNATKHNLGKKLSQETKNKISKANKGRFTGSKNPNFGIHKYGKDSPRYNKGKSVTCVTMNETFSTVKNASIKYGIDSSSIIRVCKGKQKTVGGLKFIYTNDKED